MIFAIMILVFGALVLYEMNLGGIQPRTGNNRSPK